MIKLVLFLIAATAGAAPVLADNPLRFERNGISYVGSIADRNGVRYISGHEVGNNRTFNLRVVKGVVSGDYGGDYVSYPEPVITKLSAR